MLLPLLLLLSLLSQSISSLQLAAHSPNLITDKQNARATWLQPNKPAQFILVLESNQEMDNFTHVQTLSVQSPQAWSKFTLVRQNETQFATSLLPVPALLEGRHTIQWEMGLELIVDVSCSDGIVCNGMERLVRNAKTKKLVCRASKKRLCNDGNKCTKDVCLPRGVCTFNKLAKYKSSQCKTCKTSACRTKCPAARECGFDGCFGECGECRKPGTFCASGKCVRSDGRQGTCLNPIPLHSAFRELDYEGSEERRVPTELALDVLVPRCGRDDTYFAKLPEIMFALDMPSDRGYIALEVRTRSRFIAQASSEEEDISTWSTIVIIEADANNDALTPQEICLGATYKRETQWACESEETDVNRWSQPATWMLRPGYSYFVAIERAHLPASNVTAQFRLVRGCTPNCAGKQCGDSGCVGITCGECDSHSPICLQEAGVCTNCTPVCDADTPCGGSDQCGGICICDAAAASPGELPRLAARLKPKPACNSMLPKCTYMEKSVERAGCKTPDEFCSSACQCIPLTRLLPDLSLQSFTVTVDDDYYVASAEDSCAFEEGCLAGVGQRRLLRFETNVYNQGQVPFVVPNPPEAYPTLFEFAKCHGHWHLLDFLLYQVLDDEGRVVAVGEKRSFCLMDMYQLFERPDAPCAAVYTCNHQGLSPAWSDSYTADLDCQFVDVTGLPAGTYTVRQCVNPKRRFVEASYENNCVEARVTLGPTRAPGLTSVPTPYPTLSNTECALDCPLEWIADGVCDMQCNLASCEFDGGDCSEVQTCGEEGCLAEFVGDGYCDPQCLNEACEFDGGDCKQR